MRVATFGTWPYGDEAKCNKRKMAEAGFYKRKGVPDEDVSAQCFVCGKEMDGWEIDDDPWQEHISHAPYCKFIQIGKPETELTVRQIITQFRSYFY